MTSRSAGAVQVGTLQYLAPEVLQKQPTTYASDVYAWAITVNEVLTGVFPFSDASRDDPRAQTILEFGYSRQDCKPCAVRAPRWTAVFLHAETVCMIDLWHVKKWHLQSSWS